MHWNKTLDHLCFALNCLLLFLAIFGATLQVPLLLQVAGRMHPLMLHFPIVLMLLAVIWETRKKSGESSFQRETGDVLLLSSALSAVLAALMGLLLSQEEGYDKAVLWSHKWSGVAVSLLAWAWYGFRDRIRRANWAGRAVASVSLVSMVIAGHFGATITHGENYLLAPLETGKTESMALPEDAEAFRDLVQPILKEKCLSCHNAAKAKGKLVMDTEEGLRKGGKTGKLWDSTAPSPGLMMERIHWPMEEKKHMPPKGKPQLTEMEIAILHHWIKSGAHFDQKIADLPEKDSLRILATSFLAPAKTETYDFPPADEATIKKLNTDYRAVYPLAMASPALAVDFFGIAAFNSDLLAELQPVRKQVVQLNLNHMPVKDGDLKTIARLTNLRKLNLSGTQITGATLGELKALKALRQLSLSSTAVKPADLSVLRELPELTTLYLWNTGVQEADFPELQKQLPRIHLESGFKSDTIVAKLNAPVIDIENPVFTTAVKVKLKNFIKGAVVRYTLDGSMPDSLKSPISSNDSIAIDRTCILNAKAFLPGWISSEVATRNFYQAGIRPDSIALVFPPNPQYKGKGPQALVDGKIGDTDFRNKKWMGFKETHAEALLFFKKPVTLSSVSINTLVDIGSYILPAAQVEVWGGTAQNNLTLLKKLTPKQPAAVGPPAYYADFHCPFPARSLSVLKIVVKPLGKLPPWHPGKGTPGWVFVDEIFLN